MNIFRASKDKNFNFLISFLLLCVVIVTKAKAEQLNFKEDAFYAISSLNYHLDEILLSQTAPINVEESIIFDPADVDSLWETAFQSSELENLVLAKDLYEKFLNGDSENTVEKLLMSKKLLDDSWNRMRESFLKNTRSSFAHHLKCSVDSPLCDRSIENFILPSSHWLAEKLHRIVASKEVLESQKSLNQAGFVTLFHQSSGMRVAQHNLIPGYLIKTYLTSEGRRNGRDQSWLVDRCKGAENIRNLIKLKKLRYFSVPDKWIYLIPGQPFSNPDVQTALLVVTDMNLVSRQASIKAWKTAVTRKHLEELYCILSHGFASCYLPFNIPYTKSGKFACIDTAYPQRKHHYGSVRSYFSNEMRNYWDELVKNGGKV